MGANDDRALLFARVDPTALANRRVYDATTSAWVTKVPGTGRAMGSVGHRPPSEALGGS
jgi:hypothetical protein